MKSNKLKLEVDFIGGEASLTKEEENMISDFIKSKKKNQKRSAQHRLTKSGSRSKNKTS